MSTLAVAPNQQWKAVVFGQIKERNQTQSNGFKDLVRLYNASLRKEKEYKDRVVALEKEVMSLRQENSGFKKPAGDNQRGSVSSPSPELEAKLQKLQEELTVSYKRNADNAQHMIDLSRRMKETEEQNEKCVADTAQFKQKMEEAQAEQNRLREKMEDEGKTFRILQEEHLSLRQNHDIIAEDNIRMKAENQQLVDRWLRKMAEEAEKMNTANAFYEQMVNDKQRADVINKVNPNNNGPLPISTTAPVVHKTAFFDAASFVDCNAILPSKAKRKISGHSDAVTCVAYSKSGLIMATGSTDKTIRLWDAPSGMSKNVLHGPTQSVMCLNFSPSDEALLGASNDNACRIWGVDNCRLRHTLTGHVGKVFSAVFADTQKVITGSHDRTIKLWDLTKGYCTRTDLCIAPDGNLLVSGHIDHHLRFWDSKNGEVVHVMDGLHDSQITSVSLAPDGNRVLTNSRDNTLKLVDIRTHEVIVTLKDENYRTGLNWTRACISPDGRYAAAGSVDGSLIVWNTLNGKVEKSISKAHDSAVAACSWNPMGHQFASAGDKDKTIVIWE